jgi:hypothetical protein
MEMILGYLTEEQDFESLLMEVWLGSEDDSSLETGMTGLGDRLVEARKRMQKIQEFDDTLFGEDFEA